MSPTWMKASTAPLSTSAPIAGTVLAVHIGWLSVSPSHATVGLAVPVRKRAGGLRTPAAAREPHWYVYSVRCARPVSSTLCRCCVLSHDGRCTCDVPATRRAGPTPPPSLENTHVESVVAAAVVHDTTMLAPAGASPSTPTARWICSGEVPAGATHAASRQFREGGVVAASSVVTGMLVATNWPPATSPLPGRARAPQIDRGSWPRVVRDHSANASPQGATHELWTTRTDGTEGAAVELVTTSPRDV